MHLRRIASWKKKTSTTAFMSSSTKISELEIPEATHMAEYRSPFEGQDASSTDETKIGITDDQYRDIEAMETKRALRAVRRARTYYLLLIAFEIVVSLLFAAVYFRYGMEGLQGESGSGERQGAALGAIAGVAYVLSCALVLFASKAVLWKKYQFRHTRRWIYLAFVGVITAGLLAFPTILYYHLLLSVQ